MGKIAFYLLCFCVTHLLNATPTHFYLVRHGQTDWNVERRLQGQCDTSLNEMGRKEAAERKEKLQGVLFDICISSDLQRASQTAEILISDRCMAIVKDERLRERSFGPWEGYLISDLECKVDALTEIETHEAMQERIFASLEELGERHDGATLLVVTHGGAIKNILTRLIPFLSEAWVHNLGLLHIKLENSQWSVVDMEGIEIALNEIVR